MWHDVLHVWHIGIWNHRSTHRMLFWWIVQNLAGCGGVVIGLLHCIIQYTPVLLLCNGLLPVLNHLLANTASDCGSCVAFKMGSVLSFVPLQAVVSGLQSFVSRGFPHVATQCNRTTTTRQPYGYKNQKLNIIPSMEAGWIVIALAGWSE